MSGGGAGPIILKVVKDALSVSVTPKGGVKLWYVLALTHVLAFILGKLL